MLNKKQKEENFTRNFFSKNHKAVSGVVVMVVMIALVISISAIVFTLTKKTVEEKIKSSEACGPNIIGKLSINSEYVCYDKDSDEIVFSINREDIELDKIIVAIETETEVRQFELDVDKKTILDLYSYPDKETQTNMPAKNSGRTYIATGFNEPVIGIKIIPVINDEQCDVADSLNEITPCKQTTIFSN